jgi:hypothetical protein
MFYDFYVSLNAYGFTLSGIFPTLGIFFHNKALHHFNIILCSFLGLYYSLGHYFILWFMTNEISQPFLHSNWFLMKLGYKNNHIFSKIIGFLLIFSFIISRGFINTFVLLDVYYTSNTVSLYNIKGIATITAFIHIFLNYYWIYLLIIQVIDTLKKVKK